MTTTSDQIESNSTLDPQSQDFIRNLVIAKTGVDFDKLNEEDQNKIGAETMINYIQFLDAAINEVGTADEQKHWSMYKSSDFNPKLLETLPTLHNSIVELTQEFLSI